MCLLPDDSSQMPQSPSKINPGEFLFKAQFKNFKQHLCMKTKTLQLESSCFCLSCTESLKFLKFNHSNNRNIIDICKTILLIPYSFQVKYFWVLFVKNLRISAQLCSSWRCLILLGDQVASQNCGQVKRKKFLLLFYWCRNV